MKMSWFIVYMSLILQTAVADNFTVVTTSETDGFCPSKEKRDAIIQNITTSMQAILQEKYQNSSTSAGNACGPGMWHRVAYLNMSDPSQQCPTAWREYNTSGIRACGRPVSSLASCLSVFYSTG